MNRPRYADVAATLALALALGGTAAYAAQQLPKHSVGKTQLKPDAVNSKKIKNGSVKTKDLDAKAVAGPQLADNSVTSRNIADGSVGLGDLSGVRVNGSVQYGNLAAGGCQPFDLAVPGATATQSAILNLVNPADPAGEVYLAPARVGAGIVSSQVCNAGSTPTPANATMTLRVVTLG